jgi:hypothetical protein
MCCAKAGYFAEGHRQATSHGPVNSSTDLSHIRSPVAVALLVLRNRRFRGFIDQSE